MGDEKELGLHHEIDRRDFIGMMLAGACSAALPRYSGASAENQTIPNALDWGISAADFDGYGGAGDYAGSNGNTWQVVNAAHRIRDQVFAGDYSFPVTDTGEVYDLVVVGGGPSGLGSAYHFRKQAPEDSVCLILDNHTIFGGLAKRNEMEVDGIRLMAPQGSNVFSSSTEENNKRHIDKKVLEDIGLSPPGLEYGPLTGTDKELEFDRTNFLYYYPPVNSDSLGVFFDSKDGYSLLHNPWANGFQAAPVSDALKRELMRWRFDTAVPDNTKDPDRWLDTMTYQEYLQNVHGFSDDLCAMINKFIGGGKAFNGEMCSAYAMSFNNYSGLIKRPFLGIEETYDLLEKGPVRADGFPGGNALVSRYFAKYLIPELIPGDLSPGEVINNRVNLSALDRSGQATRIRQNSTVISVRQMETTGQAGHVEIVYERGKRLYRVHARAVVMASGAWVNKHIVKDAPGDLQTAMQGINHAPALVANVALKNWRFMEKAGVTACLWNEGEFGFQCNLRRPLHNGAYRPPLDPDKPIFLTFYAPFLYPGQSTSIQASLGRQELFTTSFQDFELKIRRQLVNMFGNYGFDPARDMAGLILNRWGHAYVVPEPGFYFGKAGKPAAPDVIRRGFGRIGFAHSELAGFQSYQTAVMEAERAIGDIMEFM